MRNIISYLFFYLLLFSLTISCTDKSESDMLEDVAEENLITELPEDVISLDQIIYDLKVKTGQGKLSNKGFVDFNKLEGDIFFSKVYVVYPLYWSGTDKLAFYQSMNEYYRGSIFVTLDTCQDVDTWYIPNRGKGKDRLKNLIVASESKLRDNNNGNVGSGSNSNTEDSDDDGPKGPEEYNYVPNIRSCEDIDVSKYQ
ncbi:hypothetical protein [Tenacibaculum jejuense]|uniref:Probable lipoprotein n=1 Tax=Tenacibaculum jejuense TaxID=584609 RepID=A0A238UAN2_9FLAO|nr:hypothetical protein [Tenacibaculum jejuense]SNR15470.1 Probable lipoprotein precursor [Tenacibaculum jejuense]